MVFPAFITRKLFTVSSISNLGGTGKDSDHNEKLYITTESPADSHTPVFDIFLMPSPRAGWKEKRRKGSFGGVFVIMSL